MIIGPDESGGGVPGGSESTPGSSDDDDDNTINTGDYPDDGGGTDGYGSIGDDDDLGPNNSESRMPGGSNPVNGAVSPSSDENDDDDEATVGPDGSASIDEDRLSSGYKSVEDVVDEVRNIVGGGSNGTPQAGEITALEEQLCNFRESLTEMGESTGDPSSDGLPVVGTAGVAVVVAIGAAVLAGGDDK